MDKYSKLSSLLRGLADSATLGFGDEIVGGVKAAKDVLTTDKKLTDIGDAYSQHRDKYRADSKTLEQANPKSYLAGEAAGGLATMALPGSAIRAPSMAKAALTGAGYGAAAGLGTSEADDVANLVKDTAKGAAVGAAVAPVAQAAGQGFNALKKVINPAEAAKALPASGQTIKKSSMVIGPEIEDLVGALKANKIAGPKSADEVMSSYRTKLNDQKMLPFDKAAEEMAQGAKDRAAHLELLKNENTEVSPVTNIIDEATELSLEDLLKRINNG